VHGEAPLYQASKFGVAAERTVPQSAVQVVHQLQLPLHQVQLSALACRHVEGAAAGPQHHLQKQHSHGPNVLRCAVGILRVLEQLAIVFPVIVEVV
jgi:hypothetical protein